MFVGFNYRLLFGTLTILLHVLSTASCKYKPSRASFERAKSIVDPKAEGSIKSDFAPGITCRGRASFQVFDTVSISAQGIFKASEHFMVDPLGKKGVRITRVDTGFTNHFLSKAEEDTTSEKLVIYNFLGDINRHGDIHDSDFVSALGGEDKAVIRLGQFFALFRKQPSGERGPLLTSGQCNAAYIRDDTGVVRLVFGSFYSGGWEFGSFPLNDEYSLIIRYWAFSR